MTERRGAPGPARLRIVVVAPSPPPVTGKNVMIEALLAGRYDSAELFHVEATFASSVADMGRISLRKLGKLVLVVPRAMAARFRHRAPVLYYHPAGDDRSGILRDLLLLLPLRMVFRTVIFHLHGRGLPQALAELPRPARALARWAYRRPDAVLGPSSVVVEEAAALGATRSWVVPNGVAGSPLVQRPPRPAGQPLVVLFLSAVSEAKGAGWLLDAVSSVRRDGLDVRLVLAGECTPADYGAELTRRARDLGIDEYVTLPGLLVGHAKWLALAEADVFCVPSTYSQETFGLVLVEAASCGLPVVAADVPGVAEIFTDGESILLVDPADRTTLAAQLVRLCRDPTRRRDLGAAARATFERRYTLEHHWRALDGVFAALADRMR